MYCFSSFTVIRPVIVEVCLVMEKTLFYGIGESAIAPGSALVRRLIAPGSADNNRPRYDWKGQQKGHA